MNQYKFTARIVQPNTGNGWHPSDYDYITTIKATGWKQAKSKSVGFAKEMVGNVSNRWHDGNCVTGFFRCVGDNQILHIYGSENGVITK